MSLEDWLIQTRTSYSQSDPVTLPLPPDGLSTVDTIPKTSEGALSLGKRRGLSLPRMTRSEAQTERMALPGSFRPWLLVLHEILATLLTTGTGSLISWKRFPDSVRSTKTRRLWLLKAKHTGKTSLGFTLCSESIVWEYVCAFCLNVGPLAYPWIEVDWNYDDPEKEEEAACVLSGTTSAATFFSQGGTYVDSYALDACMRGVESSLNTTEDI